MTTYTYTTIAPPGSISSVAESINDSGQIVGQFRDSSGDHSFLDIGGTYTTIDAPGSNGATFAWDINNSGQIIGWYNGSSGSGGIGFLDTAGTFTTIVPPNSYRTQPLGMNDSEQVVGLYYDSSGGHGFLYTAGNYTTLDMPGSTYFTVASVSVRKHIESLESVVIQRWWPDSGRVTDVDAAESQTLRPQPVAISE